MRKIKAAILTLQLVVVWVLGMLLISCQPSLQTCNRLYPPIVKADTLFFKDSIVVHTKPILNELVQTIHDTFTVEKDKVIVRVERIPGFGYHVKAECPPDTQAVRYVKQIEVRTLPTLSFWHYWKTWIVIFLCGLVAYPILKFVITKRLVT